MFQRIGKVCRPCAYSPKRIITDKQSFEECLEQACMRHRVDMRKIGWKRKYADSVGKD